MNRHDRQRGLGRERLVEAALELVNQEGLDGLAMRALADRLDVKAASLYWHVRDRGELLELLAEFILDKVRRPRGTSGWRQTVLAICESLRRQAASQRDAGRILLESPEALLRSDVFADLRKQLETAGLSHAEAVDVARMAMIYVVTGDASVEDPPFTAGAVASIAVDSGSRGVVVRAGTPQMSSLVQVPRERAAAAPAIVRGETVVIRRLRGVGRGEIELNPLHPWSLKVQAPTWNTLLDLGALDVREIHVDSGATKLECYLPHPRGVVPIHISSGVVGVSIHRPEGTPAIANVHTGSVKLKLDDQAMKVALVDVQWQSEGAGQAMDRYEIDISSGVVDLQLDGYQTKALREEPPAVEPQLPDEPGSALKFLLDGVEARSHRG